MSPLHLCAVCDKPTSTIWPGLCKYDPMHTPAAALDAKKITVQEFDFGLYDMSRRLAELEQQVRGILTHATEQEGSTMAEPTDPTGAPSDPR